MIGVPVRRGAARRLGLRPPPKPTVRWSCTCEACLDQKPWLRKGKLPPDEPPIIGIDLSRTVWPDDHAVEHWIRERVADLPDGSMNITSASYRPADEAWLTEPYGAAFWDRDYWPCADVHLSGTVTLHCDKQLGHDGPHSGPVPGPGAWRTAW